MSQHRTIKTIYILLIPLGLILFAGYINRSYTDTAQNLGSFTFIQITDTQNHIGNYSLTETACETIRDLNPAFVVHTGDLVGYPATFQYQEAMNALSLINAPVYYGIGNHDALANDTNYADMFLQWTNMKSTNYSWNHEGYHFVMLDTVKVTTTVMYNVSIDRTQLDWLKEDLGALEEGTPIVLFGHHLHPDALLNFDEFLATIYGYNIKACFSGHQHQNLHTVVNNINFIVTGSLSFPKANETSLGYRIIFIDGNKVTTTWVPVFNIITQTYYPRPISFDQLFIPPPQTSPHYYLLVDVNGVQQASHGFHNGIFLNEIQIAEFKGNLFNYITYNMTLPPELLNQDINTITLTSGTLTSPTDPAGNHDDYYIKNVRIQTSTGEIFYDSSYDPTKPYWLGDGWPPGSIDPIYDRIFYFDFSNQ